MTTLSAIANANAPNLAQQAARQTSAVITLTSKVAFAAISYFVATIQALPPLLPLMIAVTVGVVAGLIIKENLRADQLPSLPKLYQTIRSAVLDVFAKLEPAKAPDGNLSRVSSEASIEEAPDGTMSKVSSQSSIASPVEGDPIELPGIYKRANSDFEYTSDLPFDVASGNAEVGIPSGQLLQYSDQSLSIVYPQAVEDTSGENPGAVVKEREEHANPEAGENPDGSSSNPVDLIAPGSAQTSFSNVSAPAGSESKKGKNVFKALGSAVRGFTGMQPGAQRSASTTRGRSASQSEVPKPPSILTRAASAFRPRKSNTEAPAPQPQAAASPRDLSVLKERFQAIAREVSAKAKASEAQASVVVQKPQVIVAAQPAEELITEEWLFGKEDPEVKDKSLSRLPSIQEALSETASVSSGENKTT